MKPLNESEIQGLVLERLYGGRDENDVGMIDGSPRVLGEYLSKKQIIDACTELAKKKLIRFNEGFAHILPKGIKVIEENGKNSPVKLSLGVAEAIGELKKNSLSEKSTYVESIQKHVFFSPLLRRMWQRGLPPAEVLYCEDGSHGYDFVLACCKVIRHVELKSSSGKKPVKQKAFKVNLELMEKPSGCVLWIQFAPDSLDLGEIRFFGNKPGEPLPSIFSFKTAKHVKGDSSGNKNERKNIRLIPKSCFQKVSDFDELIYLLFGF
jgi:hypothetical protein